ncbi:hypothetical protein HDV00_010680, partial [Rhizophlyctis rosea]
AFEDAVGQHRRRKEEEERRKRREEEKERREREKGERERERREREEAEAAGAAVRDEEGDVKSLEHIPEEVESESTDKRRVRMDVADDDGDDDGEGVQHEKSNVEARQEEAKEMMKRFSVMQLSRPVEEEADDDTEEEEEGSPFRGGEMVERDLDEDGEGEGEGEVEEDGYTVGVGRRRGSDALAKKLGVCSGCFNPVEECEC